MKQFVLFYNPVSGHAAFKNKLDWIIEAFQARDMLVIPYRTRKGGNERFVDFVRALSPDGLIVAGGDGTVHEIVNLMLHGHLDLPLAIIGSGTSNDFATFLGIESDMDRYFDAIAAGKVRPADLGRVADTYFINVASAGMMTSIAHEVDVRLKNALGKMAYYIRGIGELPRFHSFPLRIEADGVRLEAEIFLFVVANSAVVGSMKNIAEGIAIDDGKLDFLAVEKCSITKLMGITADLIAGKPISEKESVIHIQAKSLTISSEEPLQSDLDGECGPALPIHIDAIPHAIMVYCME